MGTGADFQIEVRRRQFEIGEQPLVHFDVVVLTGMNENDTGHIRALRECAHQRRHFHVVRSCADDADQWPHRLPRIVHRRPAGPPGLVDAFSGWSRACSKSTAPPTVRSNRSMRSSIWLKWRCQTEGSTAQGACFRPRRRFHRSPWRPRPAWTPIPSPPRSRGRCLHVARVDDVPFREKCGEQQPVA